MARPERHDVDYFPFYVKDGRTLFILESKYGCMGTGFFTNVMRFLCQTPDHHFCIQDDADRLFFFSKVKCDEESGMDMLNLMAKTGKILPSLWHSHKVIVCPDLIESLKDAYKRRCNEIITLDKIIEFYQNSCNNPHTTEFLQEECPKNENNSCKNPQTKLKETKLKETKVEERGVIRGGNNDNVSALNENSSLCGLEPAPASQNFDDDSFSNQKKPTTNGENEPNKPKAGAKKGVITPGNADDEAWLAQLKVNPAYKGLDIEACFWKMKAWCDANGKEPTRRRFVNWLNREERPLQISSSRKPVPPAPREMDAIARILRGEE